MDRYDELQAQIEALRPPQFAAEEVLIVLAESALRDARNHAGFMDQFPAGSLEWTVYRAMCERAMERGGAYAYAVEVYRRNGHPARLVLVTPPAKGVAPLNWSEKYKIGDQAECSACGAPISFNGQSWDHAGFPTAPQPRHIATPKEGPYR